MERRIQNSAERWPENRCCLKNAGIPGNGIGKVFLRNKLRQNGPARRAVKRSHDADQNRTT